jgi:hydroxypyruvate reductase
VDVQELAALLRDRFEETVRSFDLAARTEEALGGPPPPGPVRVLAVGKAAQRMLAGALAAWGTAIDAALLVVPEGTTLLALDPRVHPMTADHPVPTERCVAAAEASLALARPGATMLALVSGGASSLLGAPLEDATLPELAALVRQLLSSGAEIREVNAVRRRATRLGGGKLARAWLAAGAVAVRTLVASDVIGGLAHDVGSGPTVPDPTSEEAVREVLVRHGLVARLGDAVSPSSAEARHLEHRVVVSPHDLADAAALRLDVAGLRPHLLTASRDGLEHLAPAYVGLARTLAPGEVLVRVAEPAVKLPEHAGRGGRAGHLAALVARRLPRDVALLCGASDGVDGTSGAGGAVVTNASFASLAAEEVEAALRRFDTARLHAAAGTALRGGPTGLNLCDLHLLARTPR